MWCRRCASRLRFTFSFRFIVRAESAVCGGVVRELVAEQMSLTLQCSGMYTLARTGTRLTRDFGSRACAAGARGTALRASLPDVTGGALLSKP